MKIGRNAPCPCGSGLKYKKCCLGKTAAAATVHDDSEDAPTPVSDEIGDHVQSARASAPRAGQDHRQVVDAEEAARWERFWREYKRSDVDEKMRIARVAIEEEPEFDGELAFDLSSDIVHALQRAGRVEEADAFIDLIASRQPEAFAEESHWFNAWRVENAIFTGKDVEPPLLALAEDPDQSIGELFRLIDMLQYHGKSRELVAAIHKAWPAVDSSDKIMPHARDELLSVGVETVICGLLVRNPDLSVDDPDLARLLAPFRESLDDEELQTRIDRRAVRAATRWSPKDFATSQPRKSLIDALYTMSMEFYRDLIVKWQWPWLRAELGTTEIRAYLLSRDEEKKRKSTPLKKQKSKKSMSADKTEAQLSVPFLLPTLESADRHAADRLRVIFGQPYKAAAFCMAVPPWMEFLAERALVDQHVVPSFLSSFQKRFKKLPRILDSATADRVLVNDLERMWDAAPVVAAGPGAL